MAGDRNSIREHALRPHKVAVVGAGKVSSTFAYALLLNGLVGEIVLIDIDHKRAEGEAMDLNHAVPLSNPARIWAGDYPDCAGADVVVVAAGTGQRSGETRLDLVKRNAAIFKDIIPRITAYSTNGILLIATNPVDVLSYVTWKVSGFPSQRLYRNSVGDRLRHRPRHSTPPLSVRRAPGRRSTQRTRLRHWRARRQ